MCDTIIATGQVTMRGRAIFAKNSDRHPNESQHLVQIPAKRYTEGDRLQCTYISIPQVKETYATLLSQPFWMWGAEMGINEHGLVIGNEAIFTKTPANKKPALLGMDLLRLGLERAITPQDAITVITELLEEFGQGGNGRENGKLYYHNSYIIANHEDAWVLETIDKEWVARQIKETHNISNCLTIQTEWDLSSKNITKRNFNYAKKHSDFLYTTASKGLVRQSLINDTLKKKAGEITVENMTDILRHHNNGEGPSHNFTSVDVCMHAGFGAIRGDQSTASMITCLDEKNPIIFATGTSAPCTSIFKPLWIDAPLPVPEFAPESTYNAASLFWSHEPLHRAVLLNYSERLNTYRADRDALEAKFIKGALDIASAPAKERAEFSTECFRQASIAKPIGSNVCRKFPQISPSTDY